MDMAHKSDLIGWGQSETGMKIGRILAFPALAMALAAAALPTVAVQAQTPATATAQSEDARLTAFLDAGFNAEAIRTKLQEPGAAWWVAERDGELLAFARNGQHEADTMVVIANHTPVVRHGHRIGLPHGGASSLLAQASVLDLYDPDRATAHTKGAAVLTAAAVNELLANVGKNHADL
mgnify:CR=1 FL=1